MALIRCPTHGRIYDDAKDAGCPLCLQEASLPRAPAAAGSHPGAQSPEAAQSRGRAFLLYLLLVLVAGGAGAYWWMQTHAHRTRAETARDSLRALAAGPRGPDTTRFAAPHDLSPVRRARALKATLASLLHGSRGAIVGFAAGPVDTAATNRAEQRRAKQYAVFAKRWQQHLDAATRNGTEFRYGPGVRLGPQMESVTNQLQAALAVMRDLVPVDRVKPRAERQADITAATGYLNAAGTVLTNLPK